MKLFIVFFLLSQLAFRSGTGSGRYFVLDYGAKCDSITDDAAAIQRTINAAKPNGIVNIPAGTCNIGTTLTTELTPEGTSEISFEGITFGSSTLKWVGATDGILLKLVRNKHYNIKNLTFRNGVAKGTTIGVYQTGYGPALGTETLGGLFEHVYYVGFNIGNKAGSLSPLVAASDTIYISNKFDGNDIGWQNVEGNSLNHFFYELQCTENGVCLDQTQGSVSVTNGASSSDDIDFQIIGENFSIRNFRAELKTGGKFVKLTAVRSARIEANLTVLATDSSTHSVDIISGRNITLQDNLFYSRITLTNANQLLMSNNSVNGDIDLPLYFNMSAGTSKVVFQLNVNNEGDGSTFNPYEDFSGEIMP